MSKNTKTLIIVAVAAIAALVAFKNIDSIKSSLGWMSESKDEEVALPDLSNEEIENAASSEANAPVAAPAEAAAEAAAPAAAK